MDIQKYRPSWLMAGKAVGSLGICMLAALTVTPAARAQGTESVAAPESVIVVGERVYPIVDSVAPDLSHAVDSAELLRMLPGANLNANGALSGIAQYRGMYGDRVNVSIDGLSAVTGGPNSMDAPLSYASPLLLQHLSVERGIASVASSPESIGGHVDAAYDRGEFGNGGDFTTSGKLQAQAASNGNLTSAAFRVVGANRNHRLAVIGQRDRADDFDFPGGVLTPTRLERDRYDLSYAFRGESTELLAHVGQLDTSDTGTPSLPMDIRTIETDIYGFELTRKLTNRYAVAARLNRSDVFHIMDNFGIRTLPATPMDYRATEASGDGQRWGVAATATLALGDWQFGLDGERDEHSATITNPNVAAFRIENFNSAIRDLNGIFGQWNRRQGRLDIEAGLRLNRVDTASGPVGASIPAMNPTMQMMGMNAMQLAAAFNASQLARTFEDVDAVFKIGSNLGETRNLYFEIGQKSRAPSYQELYLWLPLEATGGLADGRSYIGNPALAPEVSREINIGSNWQNRRAWIAPQVFYKDIVDYIQGTPSADPVANMVATMMTGRPALEFANTDAEIYGLDLAFGYYLTDRLTLTGVVTHVSGRRTDVSDNLYRLAPLNGRVAIAYADGPWNASVELVAFAAQNRTASYNDELPTAGYGILNASMQWQVRDNLMLTATAANLLDKRYQDHLDGFNRVSAVDVAQGQRLFGLGRNVALGLRLSW